MKRHTILLSAVVFIAVLASSLVLVDHASAGGGPVATVNTGALNVRSGPGVSFNVLTTVYRGTSLVLLGRNADASWVRVALPNGVQGWVNARYIATTYPLISLPIHSTVGAVTGTVTSYALNVRSGPGVSYSRLTAIPRGTGFVITARNADGSWVKVTLANGVQGWVSARYIATSQPISTLPVEGIPVPPPPPPAPQPGFRTHVVQPGENLFRIALRYGVSMWDIARLNNILNLRLIYAGQVLLIP